MSMRMRLGQVSEEKGQYRARKLRVVKPDTAGTSDETAASSAATDASAILGNAVMYAAMSWVACCMEQAGEAVNVMPLGGGLFDAEVRLSGGGSMWLRVRLILTKSLEAGPVLSSRIEPIHP
jgi:hypothetical protein